MAITTLDGALAGMKPLEAFMKVLSGTLTQARPYTPWYAGGVPAPATANAAGVNGAALTSPVPGQIPFPASVAGQNIHLARFSGFSSLHIGHLLLCDRLWHNSGLSPTVTTAQAMTPVAIPSRDRNGAALGHGVYAGMEISTNMGAGVSTPTITYTDQDGNPGHTVSLIDTYTTGPLAGSFMRFQLAPGDVGVRSIQSFSLGVSATSGVYHLVLYRIIAAVELGAAGAPNAVDGFTGGLARMYDGTVPFLLFLPQATSTTQLSGQVIYTQG